MMTQMILFRAAMTRPGDGPRAMTVQRPRATRLPHRGVALILMAAALFAVIGGGFSA